MASVDFGGPSGAAAGSLGARSIIAPTRRYVCCTRSNHASDTSPGLPHSLSVILFQLTINVAALGIAVIGPFIGYELPLTVMQMLWVNLIMDTFAALGLATEPPHTGVLRRPPRDSKAFIVTRRMAAFIFGVGGLFLAVLTALILYLSSSGTLPAGDAASRGGTLLFTVFVLLQFWNLFNAKAMGRTGSVLPTLGNNPSFLAIAGVILIGQVAMVQFGGAVFRTVPLGATDWLWLLALTSVVLWAGEFLRLAANRRTDYRSRPMGERPDRIAEVNR